MVFRVLILEGVPLNVIWLDAVIILLVLAHVRPTVILFVIVGVRDSK